MTQPLSTEPATITAGDTITWSRSLPDYPASGGWVLHYALRGPASHDITGTAAGSTHTIKSSTTTWTAGVYSVQGYITNGTDRYTVYAGQLTVTPDLSTTTGIYDGRSHARRVLDAIEAVIEGRAAKIDLAMTIDGTQLSRIPHDQLTALRNRYLIEYKAEQRRDNVKNGKKSGRRILMRFS